LKFLSRSPDGCWTCLAAPKHRYGPALVLRSIETTDDTALYRYRADYHAALELRRAARGAPLVLEATTVLPRPIASHLNSFTDLHVFGHRRLAVSFSACPDALIEVRPADYPTGRPLRVAFLDAHDRFHVVEASSGEKGPFRELASGRLNRPAPLALTFHDEGRPIARVVLEDWAAQTATSLSPTAGWGLPANAIEFLLEGDSPRSHAAVYISLASTSVGRGWDSVGHRAGVYRNRVRIESLEPPQHLSR
jgi:hypothetical protein